MNEYKGQHLFIDKAAGFYTHHGLGIGDNKVIHYSGLANDLATPGVVEVVSLDEFSKNKEIHLMHHAKRKYTIEESIIRANLRLGEAQYHVLHNNCEHIVQWCITGIHKSNQSIRGKLLYSAGIGTRALNGMKNPVAFLAGAVAGYAYINRQGIRRCPDFEALEVRFQEQLISSLRKVRRARSPQTP